MNNSLNFLKNYIIILIIVFANYNFYAQEDNIFHNRDFWKTKPSINQVDSCINAGNSPSELDKFAFDATSWAIIEDNSDETVKYLMSMEGNDVNKKTHDGRTYIFWAMYRNNLNLMNYLVKSGAKTDIIDSHGYSLMNFGAVTGQLNTKLYDFCLENGANIKKQKNNDGANPLLLVSPFMEDENLITYFAEKGIDINETDNNGNGIFNYSAKRGNQKIMDLLIKKGINYKENPISNTNAMIFASYGTRKFQNSLGTYKYLDSIGVDPKVVTKDGETPLQNLAFKVKDLEIINFFIQKGASVDQTNSDGNNALINACYYNDSSVISLLLKHTNNINQQNQEGKSALTNAVSRNTIENIKLLIDKGCDINVKDNNGNGLLYYAIKYSQKSKMNLFSEKFDYLISKGLNPKTNNKKGENLYHAAVEKNNMEIIKKIGDYNIDINTVNKDGMTALHIAAMKANNSDIMKLLIELGADIKSKTNFGETAFDLASENEQLLKSKVNINFLR